MNKSLVHPGSRRGLHVTVGAFSFGLAGAFLHYAWQELPPGNPHWLLLGMAAGLLVAACWYCAKAITA